jgi:hypothetical protein
MTLTTFAINGQAIEDLGLEAIEPLDGWISAPSVTYGTLEPVDRRGALAALPGTKHGVRKLSLAWRSTATTVTSARTALRGLYLALQGMLEIEFVDAPGLVCYGVLEAGAGQVQGVKNLDPQLEVVGTITCRDPLYYDRAPTAIGGAAGDRITLPVGTGATRLHLWLAGGYTTPTFTLRNAAGTAIATMPLTDTAADSTVYLEFDFAAYQIDRYVSGVRSAVNNGYPYLTDGYTLFVAHALDAPTLESDSGSWAGLAWRSYDV